MEIAKKEIEAIERAVKANPDEAVLELNELQLALIGGGIGDAVFG
jgi:hypothetical protein